MMDNPKCDICSNALSNMSIKCSSCTKGQKVKTYHYICDRCWKKFSAQFKEAEHCQIPSCSQYLKNPHLAECARVFEEEMAKND